MKWEEKRCALKKNLLANFRLWTNCLCVEDETEAWLRSIYWCGLRWVRTSIEIFIYRKCNSKVVAKLLILLNFRHIDVRCIVLTIHLAAKWRITDETSIQIELIWKISRSLNLQKFTVYLFSMKPFQSNVKKFSTLSTMYKQFVSVELSIMHQKKKKMTREKHFQFPSLCTEQMSRLCNSISRFMRNKIQLFCLPSSNFVYRKQMHKITPEKCVSLRKCFLFFV